MSRSFLFFVISILWFSSGIAQNAGDGVDTTAQARIKDEALNKSQVMDLLGWIADVYGPRLSWSPEFRQAAQWAAAKLKEWGATNVHFEPFSPVGRGWTLKKFYADVIEPRAFPLIAYPKAWSPGTPGTVDGNVVYLDGRTADELQKYHGKLKGALVLMNEPITVPIGFMPDARRMTDSSLLVLADAKLELRRPRPFMGDTAAARRYLDNSRLYAIKSEFCMTEGAAVLIEGSRGSDGTLIVQGATIPRPLKNIDEMFDRRVNPYDEHPPQILPQIVVAAEQYNRLVRLVQKGERVRMEVRLDVASTDADSCFNIIAELPGTDLKDEVVGIGAHFDSWHGGDGATDNGTGSAVCMEAFRILKELNLKPRRTIRLILWGGEEEGLLGSNAYVRRHFGEREGSAPGRPLWVGGELKLKPEQEKFSVYFNDDNGAGRIRGVYLQGNEAAGQIFRSWFAAFNDPTAQTISLGNTGGTDHLSFDAVGLPGFQFIQDRLDYETRTHHTNMDLIERVPQEDLKQAAAVMAVFAYNAAMRDQLFPRKPVPSMQSTGRESVH